MKYFAVFLKPADKEVAKRLKDEHIAYVKTCCKEGKSTWSENSLMQAA